MSHQHYCDVTGHLWTCYGTASRPPLGTPERVEPSQCMCPVHQSPMDEGNHADDCPVELLACPVHQEQERKRLEDLLQRLEDDAAALGYAEMWDRAMVMPYEPKASLLMGEVWSWVVAWVEERQ